MNKNQAGELLEKYLNGQCTPDECAIVEKAYNELVQQNPEHYTEHDLRRMVQETGNRIDRRTRYIRKPAFHLLYPYAAAAILLIAFGIAMLYYVRPANNSAVTGTAGGLAVADALPGGNKAYLVLGNGAKIDLSSADTQKLANKIDVKKNEAGTLVYTPSHAGPETAAAERHTVVTPRGGQYSIQLPDGSRVWLNAASRLEFPSNFHGMQERKVTLHGEGYFEVAGDATRPFIVETETQQVKVLGTHFNINAYPDERAVVTTLLEGAVSVGSARLKPVRLVPGQQAVLKGEAIAVQPADENAVAWKQGKFRFNDTELPSLMRQVSRWYNIEVVYEGNVPDKKFTGGISRNTNLSNLIRILQQSDIGCVLENRAGRQTLIVKNQSSN